MAERTLETKPRKLIPLSQPISPLPTEAARLYTHVHPVLLLTLYYLTFPYLVADPVSTLTHSLPPLSILQLTYCILCLPPSSSSSSNPNPQPPPSKTPKRKRVQFAKPAAGLGSKIVPAILSLLLSLLLAAPLLTLILILLGAPLTTHLGHNLLCATHMALLGALPLFYVHGVNARMWREIAGACLPFDEVWGGAVGTAVGGWLGAVPIPLDWDREWQKWPVTVITGAYAGWAVFRLAGVFLLKGKRIEFD